MWKPGQLVTIRSKVCRVRKSKPLYNGSLRDCILCTFVFSDINKYPCIACCSKTKICKLPKGCHLEAIK